MADTGNPIRFEDLIHSNVETGLDGLITKVGQVQGSLLEMLKNVKKESATLADALSGVSSASKGDRDMMAQYAAEIDKLHAANDGLLKVTERLRKEMDSLKKAKRDEVSTTQSLEDSYASLADVLKDSGINLEELLTTERQRQIAFKNGKIANESLSGSYNQLYAQYNLLKNVINALGKEMEQNTGIVTKLSAVANGYMNQLKAMQAATGKHTLSVGDYGKALNGLHISFNQITRELPSLTNSASQFAIAISNNIPLFTDAIRRYSDEHKRAKLAFDELIASGRTEAEAIKELGESAQFLTGTFKATIKVFSTLAGWIGIISAVIPLVTKMIEKHRKEQEKLNEVTEETITLAKLDAEANRNAFTAITQQITKLDVLYYISQDINRSWRDRIEASRQLKQEYKEELANISAESIAMGNAATIMDTLREKMVKQAETKAYLNEITNLTIKAYDLEKKAMQANAEIDAATTELAVANANRRAGAARIIGESQAAYDARQSQLVANANKAARELERVTKAYESLGKQQEDVAAEIKDLKDRIDPFAFTEELNGRGRKSVDKFTDYYWEWREAFVRNLEDEEWREIALSDLRYEHSIANLQNELKEQKKAGELSVQQEKYLTDIMANLEIERQTKRKEIIKKFYDETLKEVMGRYNEIVEEEMIEEEDLTITGRYNKLFAANAESLIAAREKLNEVILTGTFKEAKAEGQAFKELTIEKLKLEQQYQAELLKMRRDTGTITEDEYKKQLATLQINLAKSIASLNRRRRTKFSLWNLIFGETMEDGKGNVWKELSPEAQAFVSTFEQAMSTAFGFMDEWMDKRMEMAEVAIEAAKKETEAAKSALDYEQEARANGYANNVELARSEYEEKLKYERLAIAEKQRLQRIQESIDTAQQISSLVTATAELWEAHASIPFAGRALAIAATAAMWSSFLASKVAASQLATTKYGDGMSEYLNYGGSHASGNDIDFGVDKNGKRRRVERGEMIGVINKKNVDKYGVGRITDIITSLNNGTFESKYSSLADVVLPEMNADLYHLAFAGFNKDGKTDLGVVESSLQTLIEQGETRVVNTPYGRIEYKGNNKRIIRNS